MMQESESCNNMVHVVIVAHAPLILPTNKGAQSATITTCTVCYNEQIVCIRLK